MADTASVILQPLTAFAWTPGGSPSARQLTAFASSPGGAGVMLPLTGASTAGSFDSFGFGAVPALTGVGQANVPNVGTAAGSLLPLTGSARTPTGAAVTLQQLVALGQSDSGQRASGAPTLLALTASGIAIPQGAGAGTAILQQLTAKGVALNGGSASAALALRSLYAQATGVTRDARGSAVLQALIASGNAGLLATGAASGVILVPRMRAYAQGDQELGLTLDSFAMNMRNNAVTRFPAYGMNSLARYNGAYLGAGPNGLFLLEGGDTTDDVGWDIRTGQLDDKTPELKRLTEVLLGCRYDGPVRLRVWKDDVTFYDYSLPNLRPDTLQQVRVKAGKGTRSRYFKVELLGFGSRFELDSLQATMPKVTRRIG
jgi:hypothetical protein